MRTRVRAGAAISTNATLSEIGVLSDRGGSADRAVPWSEKINAATATRLRVAIIGSNHRLGNGSNANAAYTILVREWTLAPEALRLKEVILVTKQVPLTAQVESDSKPDWFNGNGNTTFVCHPSSLCTGVSL